MENEVWKTYPEFPWVQGSSLGRIRTLDRVVSNGKGMYVKKGHVVKQCQNNWGYLCVGISANGKHITRSVHRIIASCFLPNQIGLPEVNHIDNNPLNNNVSNLEWCTGEYNIAYREKYGTSAAEAVGRPVFAINLKTTEVLWFPSQSEASRELGVNCGNLNSVLTGRYNRTGGYWFTYDNENAVESTRAKFGNEVADKVEQLVKDKELQLA